MKKSFDNIYEEIYKKSSEKLKKMKNKIIADFYFLIISFIVLNFGLYILTLRFSIFFIIISVIFITISMKNEEKKFNGEYKKLVVSTLVSKYRESFLYVSSIGIPSIKYNESGFDNSYDKFYSEDLINGKLEDGTEINMSEITTKEKRRYTDSDGHTKTEYVVTFQGLYGYIELNYYISNNINLKINSFFRKNSKNRIELESAEFEKKYDLVAKDKIHALKIFTPKLAEKISKITRRVKKPLEIKILGNRIFFRVNCGKIFEPPMIKDGVDYSYIRKFYDLLNYPVEIIEEIIENSKNAKI